MVPSGARPKGKSPSVLEEKKKQRHFWLDIALFKIENEFLVLKQSLGKWLLGPL